VKTARRPPALRVFLVRALLAVLLPVVVVGGWLHYRSAQYAAQEFAQQLAGEVAERVRERIEAFFDVPQRVVAYQLEQARTGLLRYDDVAILSRQFLLQIAQQPQLTFVSMGLADGRYVAGSRPPLGADRQPRILLANPADGGAVEVFRVGLDDRPTERVSRSDAGFDPRRRPWYETAAAHNRMSWYAPYRYRIDDLQGAYGDIGIGVSAPVRADDGTLVGVVAADVALSQIDDFLSTVALDLGGVAFMADADGMVLASSAGAADGRDAKARAGPPRLESSNIPVLRAMGEVLRLSPQPQGSRFIEAAGQRHLARWWTHPLPQGPELTVGIVLPESRFNSPMRGALRNIVYLTLAVMLACVLLAVHVAGRVVRPLAALGDWAARLTRGDWQARAPATHSIRELTAVADAMRYMADHLKEHAEQLEHVVAQRTAALEQALRAVEKTLEDQRHFIAMLSHEVRSPVAVVHTAAQLLVSRLRHDPSQRAVVERILRGSTRLVSFFDNCLTQDRMDSHNFALEPVPVDVGAMVTWVVDNAAQLTSGHALQATVESGLPLLHGDQVLLRILLTNLLSNAFKYTPPGTAVGLQVSRHGSHCRFMVEDEGPGIPPQEAEIVFEKYRRGRAAEGQPGAGLGLALVQRIAALHDGTVVLEGREPHGSRFIVDIPFEPSAKTSVQEP
jgi:signal transduction histidine kinase